MNSTNPVKTVENKTLQKTIKSGLLIFFPYSWIYDELICKTRPAPTWTSTINGLTMERANFLVSTLGFFFWGGVPLFAKPDISIVNSCYICWFVSETICHVPSFHNFISANQCSQASDIIHHGSTNDLVTFPCSPGKLSFRNLIQAIQLTHKWKKQ